MKTMKQLQAEAFVQTSKNWRAGCWPNDIRTSCYRRNIIRDPIIELEDFLDDCLDFDNDLINLGIINEKVWRRRRHKTNKLIAEVSHKFKELSISEVSL